MIMRTKLTALLFAVVLISPKAQAQTAPVYIPWENGKVSLLSELEPVWIILKKGSTLKNVRIREIQNAKGIVVYQKEGTLHDVQIANIKHITAGNPSKSAMYFDDNNNPVIKPLEVDSYYAYTYADFKFNADAKTQDAQATQRFLTSSNSVTTVTTPEKKTEADQINNPTQDTIVKGDGEILAVKILEITPTRIRFKKADNPEGPVYILGNQTSVKIIKRPKSTKIILHEN